MTGERPEDMARRIVAAASTLTLATAGADGRPWATPVWYASRGWEEFVWASRPEARHSRNIGLSAMVAGVVIDPAAAPGEPAAVYVEALAHEVADGDRPTALALYSERSQAAGFGPWDETRVTAPAPHRLYRATVERVYVLGEGDRRIAIV